MTVLQFDRGMDYLNLTCIAVNVVSILFLKCFVHKFKKKTAINLLNSRTRSFVDGILIIESLFFGALYVWINTQGDKKLGGMSDPSLLLYIIAENCKSFYFLSVILLTWQDVRTDANHILDALRGRKDNGSQC